MSGTIGNEEYVGDFHSQFLTQGDICISSALAFANKLIHRHIGVIRSHGFGCPIRSMRLFLLIVLFVITVGVIAYQGKALPRLLQKNGPTNQAASPNLIASPATAPTPPALATVPPAPAHSNEAPGETSITPAVKATPKVEVVQVTPVTVDVSKLPEPVAVEPTAQKKSHPFMPGPGPKPADAPVAPPQR